MTSGKRSGQDRLPAKAQVTPSLDVYVVWEEENKILLF